MTWFYLFAVVLLTTGQPGAAPPRSYISLDECNAEGQAFAAQVRADATVKQAAWECIPVDFDVVDPVLEPKRPA